MDPKVAIIAVDRSGVDAGSATGLRSSCRVVWAMFIHGSRLATLFSSRVMAGERYEGEAPERIMNESINHPASTPRQLVHSQRWTTIDVRGLSKDVRVSYTHRRTTTTYCTTTLRDDCRR